METKTAGVCVGKQRNDKVARVAIKNAFIIVTFVDQPVQALLLATEGHTVRTQCVAIKASTAGGLYRTECDLRYRRG